MKKPRQNVAPAASKPKTMGTRTILFNAGAGIVIIAGIGTGIKTILVPPQIDSCVARYERATMLTLDANGQRRSVEELQAAANGRDSGIVENMQIRSEPGAKIPTAMVIKFDQDSAMPNRDANASGGIIFPWEPRAFQAKDKACLSYSIQVPADFKFGRAGTLPGFLSSAEGSALEAGAGFEIRPVWNANGFIELATYVNNAESNRAMILRKHDIAVPRDRWVRIDQELALNTPGQSNGINRLWVDGVLAAESTSEAMRRTQDVKIGHVGVDVHFSNRAYDGRSPKNQKLMLSPVEVRWN